MILPSNKGLELSIVSAKLQLHVIESFNTAVVVQNSNYGSILAKVAVGKIKFTPIMSSPSNSPVKLIKTGLDNIDQEIH